MYIKMRDWTLDIYSTDFVKRNHFQFILSVVKNYYRLIQQHQKVTMWLIMILLGICFPDWITGIDVRRGSYNLSITAESEYPKSLLSARCILYSTGSLFFCMADPILDMSGLELEIISKHALDELEHVENLNLRTNKLTKLPARIFSKMTKLETLSLANNKIHRLNINLSGLNEFKRLDLSNNNIKVLTNMHLLNIPKYVEIIMEGNGLEFMRIKNSDNALFSISSSPETTIISETATVIPKEPRKTQPPWDSCCRKPYYVIVCRIANIIIESISLITEELTPSHCNLEYVGPYPNSLILNYRGMTKFKRGWFKISNDYFSNLSLWRNRITEITPELLNELPEFITHVSLASNGIESIRSNIINMKSLEILELDQNSIFTIEDDAFKNTSLDQLSLSENSLSDLDFTRTLPTSMKQLIVSFNHISKITENSLINLKELEDLNLAANYLFHISEDTFRGLNKLRRLNLSFNRLRMIESGTFHQESLSELDLSYNNILELNHGIFKDLKNMAILHLSFNGIVRITGDTFSGLKKSIMTELRLNSNHIHAIEERSFADMTIHTLALNTNELSEKSIAKSAFESCTLRDLILDDNQFGVINGDSFYGIRIDHELSLNNNQIKSIKKGDASYIGCPADIRLNGMIIERIENGAFYEFQKCYNVTIRLDGVKYIQAGIFDDV